jgi:integrase
LLSLPLGCFPESFAADLERYPAVASGRDILTKTTRRKPVRAGTLHDQLRRLRQLASVQVKTGRPIEEITSISALFEDSHIENALQWYLDQDGERLRRARVELIGMLIGIGKHHLQLPPARLDQLRTICKRVGAPRQVRMTDRNLSLLQQLRDGRTRRAFYSMAETIFAEIKGKPVTKRTALLAQVAVVHAILTNAPMRFGNLLELDFEQHLRSIGSGPRATFQISIAASDVKNDQHLEFELTLQTAAMLCLYRDRYRPVLAEARGSTLLFPGRKGGHKHHVTLAQQLCRMVRTRTGIRLHPHLYRHIAAYIYLRAHPGDFETVRQLLGHTSIDTTRRFYADFDRFFAHHQYLKVLEGEALA